MHKYFLNTTVANVYNKVKNVIETLNVYKQQRLLNGKAMKQYLNSCMIALETTFGKAIQIEQNRLPDILLHFSRPTRTSPDAVYRFNTIDYLSPTSTFGVTSLLGGKRCTILPRSLNCRHSCPDQCGCVHAKLDYVMVIEPEPNGNFSSPQGYTEANHTGKAANLQRTDFQIGPLEVDCKIHVHQGRFFSTHDENQLSNVKLSVLFENYEATFSPIANTLSPIWNETAEMHNVPFATVINELNPKAAQKCTLALVLHNNSTHKSLRALGFLESSVTWSQGANLQTEEDEVNVHRFNTVLRWVPMYNDGVRVAEILMSSNILKVQSTERTVGVECFLVQSLPQEIAPQLCVFTMRVCFIGLRQIYRKPCAMFKRMRVLVTVGNGTVTSGYSGLIHGHSVNFPDGCETTCLNLPLETHYWPSVIIKLIDYSDTKRPTVVSIAIVTDPEMFLETTQPPARIDAMEQPAIIDVTPIPTAGPDRAGTSWVTTLPNIATMIASKVNAYKPKTTTKSARKHRRRTSTNTHTWWTKFYSSLQDGNQALTVYDRELESVTKFSGFKDWSGTYSLYKARRTNDSLLQNDLFGFVKCRISIVPEDLAPLTTSVSFKSSSPGASHGANVVVVVYVVQALNLASRDVSSESDAYIVLTYGKRCVRDRSYYIPNQSSPVFGRRFELHGEFPRDQMLQLSIYDRDFASPDDLIGSTFIDIEDRFRSKHRPGFGLPKVYTTQGYNQWRHLLKPSQMLQRLLQDHRLPFAPRIEGSKIMVGSAEFVADEIDPDESQSEQLCLLALNNFEHIAGGCSLTPEHVETRSLYHPKRGGIEQGKVQLWVEIYEPDLPHPRPLDITPQPPRPYELRLIVWNTADVVLNERNIFGTEMSDIYVKCWLQEFTEAQSTDVHYRSLTGEGNFNWRMIFPFHYSPADATIVIRRKKAFYERFDTETKYPPVLTVQIWDNDSFSADDFLGTLELNLSRLPPSASSADRCKLYASLEANNQRFINLFELHRIRGWFPVHGRSTKRKDENSERTNDIVLTGKIELELEVLSQLAAGQSPVGMGRNPPHHLPEPLRPEVSFNWLHQPRKTLKKLLWPRVRKSVVYFGAVVVVCLLIYGIVVNAPALFLRRSSTVVLSGASSSVGN
ncbi:fer-1-like protein 6 [Anopheles bellator]|uniref:fer-1-like protein 6 n=1 Tax=Anopheles bellator TaxID=139047 RepID=UPI002649990F|nr:fer-1-like protein 6 [Anopheles bellator]